MKQSLVHETSTTGQFRVKLLLRLFDLFGFRLFSIDVTQTYLQRTNNFLEYVEPPSESELDPDHLLKLFKQLYGLIDSSK